MTHKRIPIVYVVSDAAGDTGEAVVKAAVAQFHPRVVEIRRFPFVETRADVDRVVNTAQERAAIIIFTLVIPELREYMVFAAKAARLVCIDLLGDVIDNLEKMLGVPSQSKPGMLHQLNEDYFKKVEAVEFAVRFDDGRDPSGVIKADIVLVGVSRTSKTPLSMYLAHKTFKVANVPIVPEIQPPDQLFTVSPNKIIGLRINAENLNKIRRERLKSLGLRENAPYANQQRIEQELAYADDLMKKLGCFQIDVSNKAVEETAGLIMERIGSIR